MKLHGPAAGKPHLTSVRQWLRVMACGMCMGAADLIPGFSGGTVAFITGIYPDLIRSVVSFNSKALQLLMSLRFVDFFRSVGWEFLLALVLGISLSVSLLVRGIHAILGDPVERTYLFAAFMGLVLASILFCARQVAHWGWQQFGSLLFGVLVAFAATSISMRSSSDIRVYDVVLPEDPLAPEKKETALVNYDSSSRTLLGVSETSMAAMLAKGVVEPDSPTFSHQEQREGTVEEFVQGHSVPPIDPWLVICGMIAITALLLPGMSGCYMLTILGTYPIVIGALADLVNSATHLSIDVDAVFVLTSVALGIVIGLATSSRIVSWLLHHYHDLTVAAMTGFMIGALRAVWPFWSYEYQLQPLRLQDGPQLQPVAPILPDVASSSFWLACGVMLLGFSVVMVLEWVGKRLKKAHALG